MYCDDSLLIQYKNATYQGGFLMGRRFGQGILITDQNDIFVGYWKEDLLHGKTLAFLNKNTHVIGNFEKGQMQGYFIFRNNKGNVIGLFQKDELIGKLLVIDNLKQVARVLSYQEGTYKAVSELNLKNKGEKQIIHQTFGDQVNFPTLEEFIQKELLQDLTYIRFVQKFKIHIQHRKSKNTNQTVGFILHNNQIQACGLFIDKKLQGLGFITQNYQIDEGEFKKGKLNGLGFKINQISQDLVLGNFQDGEIEDIVLSAQTTTLKIDTIKKIKKQIHLKSLNYFNSFVNTRNLIAFRGNEHIFPSQETGINTVKENIRTAIVNIQKSKTQKTVKSSHSNIKNILSQPLEAVSMNGQKSSIKQKGLLKLFSKNHDPKTLIQYGKRT